MSTSTPPAIQADLNTLMRERNEEHASRAAAKFALAVQPIYGANDRSDPVHIGSAVLLDVHGTKVMITAAHVIDNNSGNRPTSLYVGGGANLELIDADFAVSAAPNYLRKLDRYDIAFCALPPALIEKLGGTYIGVADMARHAPYEQGRLYTAIGFPNTMNKVSWPERKARKLHPEMLRYTNTYRLDEEVARGLPNGGENHIFIPYGDKWKDVDGFVENAKKPIGMSGGAMIDCGKASTPETAAGTNEPTQRLAGISVEFKEERVMIATRMAVILPELEKHFPPPSKEKC
ncbi:hypothetical protein [Methylobacterium brachythecii]|nr:hypothetical protein [Methylobacterium brachythecii]MBB3903950.1 hypothetical protein [Methylobacterium brachythecii]